jgi:hypothetical protein
LPTDAAAGIEVTGLAYARQLVTWAVPTDTGITSATHVTFGAAGSVWGLVVGFGVWDATTTGNLLYYGPVAPHTQIDSGDTYRLPTGAIVIGLD